MMQLVLALTLCVGVASAQTVTATKLVSYGKGKELLRKINGQWWSQDNREVYPPSKGGVFWELDSKPGVVEFYHHQPFDLDRAESLHLFMSPDQVEAVLGKPNRIFRMGPDGGMWSYYAANGTKLEVRIMAGVLGEAEYDPVGRKKSSVVSVAQELGGQSIYHLLAQRATQRSEEDQARRVAAMRSQMPSAVSRVVRPVAGKPVSNAVLNVAPTAEPEKHIVTDEALASIEIGASRAEVLAALGEPSAKYSMAGGDGVRETFRYHWPDGAVVEIKLVDGKVTAVP